MQNHYTAQHGHYYPPPSSGPPKSHEQSAYPDPSAPYQHRRPPNIGPLLERPAMSTFSPPHDAGSVSPHDNSPYHGESLRSGGYGSGAPSPVNISSMMMHNPKRAYRQRRKDPSCDACRERKVKCDATDTSSCTECSSRNVRCQFTKDTNRRMSSIKQVQDLERQLLEARQQLERVRANESKVDPYADFGTNSPAQPLSELPFVGRSPRRMLKARTPQDLSNVRTQLSDYGRGLLKPPVTGAPVVPNRKSRSLELPPLPSRADADQYLSYYFECIHRQFPVVHWHTFHQHYLEVFDAAATYTMAPEWIAVLFVVLACGALSTRDPSRMPEAQDFLTRAVSTINFWEDDVSTNQAVVAFLASIFLAEVNRKSASWIWLGSAIRIAQDLGLHVQGGQWSPIEGEMRKRIWYSFYAWDRLLASELGKPMLINDDECDTEYPDVLDDERGMFANSANLGPPLYPSTLLLATIHVTRLLAPLAKLFRSLCITSETLTKFESHLRDCMEIFPPALQLSNPTPLDPRNMLPPMYFQNIRLLLHRHNLSPSCSPEQRSEAVRQCLEASRDTARIVSRCLAAPGHPQEVERSLVLAATTMCCTHVWRSMLFLLFRPLDEAFFVMLRAVSMVGTTKAINTCCGRHLAFCVRRLIEKFEQPSSIDLEQDEEFLVYLSGDLQASTNSWVWGNAETGTHLSRRQKHGRPKAVSQDSDSISPVSAQSSSWDSMLSEDEQHNWGGWQNLERAARYLAQLQAKRMHHSPPQQEGPVSILPRNLSHDQAGPALTTKSPTSQSTDSGSSRSRMAITSII